MPRLQHQANRIPKYVQLADMLRQQIESGQLKPGDQLPSLALMKAEHGISQATWEKIHSLLEEEGVVVRKPGQGTFITDRTVQRRNSLSGNLGFTGEAFRQPHWVPHPSHLLSGIQDVAGREGVNVLLLNSAPDPEWAKVDGLFLCDPDAAVVFRRAPETMPCVSLLMPLPTVPSVTVDDYEGSRSAAQHLIELGHRRIAYLQVSAHPQVLPRLQGYRGALREAGIEPQPDWINVLPAVSEDIGNRESGYQLMTNWLQNGWRELGCTAMLVQNDEAAIGAIEALQQVGLSVPGHVSIVGFDGTELADYSSPRLTTVQVPFAEIGAKATEVLLERIQTGSTDAVSIVLPTTLRMGRSTAPLPQP